MERNIVISDRGIAVNGEWTVGEVLAMAQALATSINATKIGVPLPQSQPEDAPKS
jgi:hypothetical protein